MGALKIETIKIADIKPYRFNAKKHPQEQIDQIKQSIKEFGMNDPIAVWGKDNTIIEGHGRYFALKQMGIKECPVVRLDHLTDEQRRAYTLVHNQLTLNTGFDIDILNLELEAIPSLDLSVYDLEIAAEQEDDGSNIRSAFEHNVFDNLERMFFESDNYYGIPVLKPTQTSGDKFLRFMDYGEVPDPENYIAHFFYDDYKFIQAWKNPDTYIDKLRRFKAVVAPDFSSYTDFPKVLQILGAYRRNWVGAYWQEQGIDIIPDVQWGNKETYNWCFDGIPKDATVAISSLGVSAKKDWNGKDNTLFRQGFEEMMTRLHPKTILWYGGLIEGCEGNIIHVSSFYDQKRESLNEKAQIKKTIIKESKERNMEVK